ncbi:hypothetical protein [Paracoccus methylarcula]|uniref:hypothetical protein n=1 Tax=Paracoccus methylarcula TaxID=72022 RepID=UPI001B877139|nr:hypothetical protein [Paracoccus methylarcula]
MKDTLMNREELKLACLALLDEAAVEHPSGHQGKSVARYILRSVNDDRIELMFEKGENSRANLWVAKSFARDLMNLGIECKEYPASDLNREVEPGKPRRYGRHAALKQMRDLAHADLVRFTVENVSQMKVLIAGMKSFHLQYHDPDKAESAAMPQAMPDTAKQIPDDHATSGNGKRVLLGFLAFVGPVLLFVVGVIAIGFG